MKLQSIFSILILSAAVACVGEKDVRNPIIATEAASYDMPANGGSVEVMFISNMPWEIKVAPGNAASDVHDIKVVPSSGEASVQPITVQVKAGANDAKKRTAVISILGPHAGASITLVQAGMGDVVIEKGTLATPYPANELHALMKGGEVPTGDIYIRGKVSKVGSIDVTQYHNATFWLTDDGTHPTTSDNDAFQIFRAKDYGKADVSNAELVKTGDVVTVLGPVTVYTYSSGEKAYETVANQAQVLAVNGLGTPSGEGTAESPYNVGKAMARIAETGETSTEEVYIKGVIAEVLEISTAYGNATYYISDDGYLPDTKTSILQVFRGKSFDNASFTGPEDLMVGDAVVVKGTLVNYKGNTPEVNQGNVLVSLNGKTE